LVFKDGKITEKIFGNAIDLGVLMQDDGCLRIATLDWIGNEDAIWTALYYNLRPLHYCGMFVQSSIEYKGATYHGLYFGQFDSKDCGELYISGLLHGEMTALSSYRSSTPFRAPHDLNLSSPGYRSIFVTR